MEVFVQIYSARPVVVHPSILDTIVKVSADELYLGNLKKSSNFMISHLASRWVILVSAALVCIYLQQR